MSVEKGEGKRWVDEPIRPRTDSERRALLTGYAMAIDAVDREGISAAREWLRMMAEAEGAIQADADLQATMQRLIDIFSKAERTQVTQVAEALERNDDQAVADALGVSLVELQRIIEFISDRSRMLGADNG